MSMPSFPENPDITRDEALDMILASIAIEELALSHIINAEGEKLQYILGTLHMHNEHCATTSEILAVNQSVRSLLDSVMENQVFLKKKMEKVLEYLPHPSQCVPPKPCPGPPDECSCPPPKYPCREQCSAFFLEADAEYCWNSNEKMNWSNWCRAGSCYEWDCEGPDYIVLPCGCRYVIEFQITASVCDIHVGVSLVCLQNNRTLIRGYTDGRKNHDGTINICGKGVVNAQNDTVEIALLLNSARCIAVQQGYMSITCLS